MAEFPFPLRAGSFRCPAHQDRTPSLSITLGSDGRWLVHCHAGCAPEVVLAAVGLSFHDLAPPGSLPPRPRALPPPAAPDESDRVIAEALGMMRAQERRVPPGTFDRDDLIRNKRRVADAVRRWVTARGPDTPMAWDLLEHAAELDTEAENLEADA